MLRSPRRPTSSFARTVLSGTTAAIGLTLGLPAASPKGGTGGSGVSHVQLADHWQRHEDLKAGQVVEIAVRLERPSALPANGRVGVEWSLKQQDDPKSVAIPAVKGTRPPAAFGIYTAPTANWRKVLHALDGDVYLVYRAPVAGRYTLTVQPVTDEEPVGEGGPRWRERGAAPQLAPLPRKTPWPNGTAAPLRVSVKPLPLDDVTEQAKLRTYVECEPNDTPEQAQSIPLTPAGRVTTWEVTGGADDIEFFDNGKVGRSGDDWFRLDYRGKEPHLLTAQLSLPGQTVAARIRCYRLDKKDGSKPAGVPLGTLLPVAEYKEGQDGNERAHQQDEEHRANICRLLKPGETYFLRVEANAPGYQLQLRLVQPAPYDDPRLAVRQGMYTHIGQVDAWLTNRPRGASVERRVRDTGNLLGTNCMSCHTQTGVWGPAVPLDNGYRVENVQNYWHLANVMYECLRPTNELKDAANNTSLAPLDLGDGPAGTRVAGFNIVSLERVVAPRKLHSAMQRRTANFVLQSADPGGINAAGPGSNIGQVVVYLFASEILKTAWEQTGEARYFQALDEKARKVLAVSPRFSDDVALRLEYFGQVLPIGQYADLARRANCSIDRDFIAKVKAQLAEDERRLRAIQNADGSWGFNPGTSPDGGKTWRPGDNKSDPAPTALAVTGLTARGHGKDDPAVSRGVKALLKMQDPTGRWNRAAQTGFVTTAYALHALSRLYPARPSLPRREDFVPRPGETLVATLRRVQALALTGEPRFVDLLLDAAWHDSPLVRYWAVIGLGGTHTEAGVAPLLAALADPAKPVRDAATWALRQTLLDDHGWDAVFAAYERGDDYTREHILQALNMRADAVMSRSAVSWPKLTALLDRAMNDDPHPAVRAWATKAAWQWWVWNPPVRQGVNTAWVKLLQRPESNALAENCLRYSSHALFIANGHKANGSKQHQYKELAELFEALARQLDGDDPARVARLRQRLVGVGATFYATSGGDGGPGQLGYVTLGAGELMGRAALVYLEDAVQKKDLDRVRLGLEGAAGVPFQPLTSFLVDYSLNGPESLRQLAANAVSDPRTVKLAAVPELIGPQLAQVQRGAAEPPRRPQISDPILTLWARVNWVVPKIEEQQRNFFDLMVPRFEQYQSPAQTAALPDSAKRAEAERRAEASWYLADRLGNVLKENPDLHLDIVFRHYFPKKIRNPLEAHLWLPSVGWLLTHKTGMTAGPRDRDQPSEDLIIKDRVLQLYLDQLQATARPETRATAVKMANQTVLRNNPEVLVALGKVLTFEKGPELRKIAENVLKQGQEKFLPDLLAALKREKDPSVRFDKDGTPKPTTQQLDDVIYFRDHVVPELARQKRDDQKSCLGCHGVPGRVPSLTLRPADDFGYLSVPDLLANYRLLQKRIDTADPGKSKLLRKPLNIQDGQEDGHQGGRRYGPTDEGYLILKRWAENQARVQQQAAK